jgi:hypothetical protein
MRKIRIIEQISLEGVIQAPGAPNEDGDYPHGGWAVPHSDPAVGEAIDAGTGRLSICCWAAEPTISGATIGRKPRTI